MDKFQPSLWQGTLWGMPDSLGCTENGAPHNLLRVAEHKSCWRCGEWFKDQPAPDDGDNFDIGFIAGGYVRFFKKPVESIVGKLKF